jgi:uncharacterized membrane protein
LTAITPFSGYAPFTEDATMLKTFTFALIHIFVAFTVVYLLTGSAWAGGAVALIEPACNTVAYHFHEKAWEAFRRRSRWVAQLA